MLVCVHKIQVKEYSSTKNEFPRIFNAGLLFLALSPDFKLRAISLNYFDKILNYFPSEQKFKEFSLFTGSYFQVISMATSVSGE